MRPILISTDSTADLPEQYLIDNNVDLHPLHYIIDDVEYGKELDIEEPSLHEFYDMVRAGKMPTTNATSLDNDIKMFKAAAEAGYDVIHIPFSAKMSTSCNNCILAAQEVMDECPDANIFVFDTKSGSGGQAIMVRKAVDMKNAGKSFDEIKEFLLDSVSKTKVFVTVPDLTTLCRGGRVSKSSALVGNVLKIQPTLIIDAEGGLEVTNKMRGRKAAMNFLVDTLKPLKEANKLPDEVAIGHGDCIEDAEVLANMVKEAYGIEKIHIAYLCQTLGSHTGPNVLTLSYIEK